MKMHKKEMAGFSLLEALITALILAIGLLGMAGLQATALRNNHGAYLRSQAVIMAYDMMDRMRANKTAATSGSNYDRDYADLIPSQVCTATCSGAQMADADEKEWIESVQKLPSGDGAFSVDANDVATVNVRWDDRRTGNPADFTIFTLSTVL